MKKVFKLSLFPWQPKCQWLKEGCSFASFCFSTPTFELPCPYYFSEIYFKLILVIWAILWIKILLRGVVSLPIIAVMQLACNNAFQSIGEALAVRQLANGDELAREELCDNIWGRRFCPPANCKCAIFIAPPMVTWVRDTATLFKSTAPHSSLVVGTRPVHEEAIFTRRKPSWLYRSFLGTE